MFKSQIKIIYLKHDIIEPPNSYLAAPAILCKKKDGIFRFPIDYRKLTAVTVTHYPLPGFDVAVDSVSTNQSKIFTVIYLKSTFHQLELDPKTKHNSTFTCHVGHFKRLPYGLINAPVAFQKRMGTVPRDIDFKFTLVYVDDMY